jgi:hypothetical protein
MSYGTHCQLCYPYGLHRSEGSFRLATDRIWVCKSNPDHLLHEAEKRFQLSHVPFAPRLKDRIEGGCLDSCRSDKCFSRRLQYRIRGARDSFEVIQAEDGQLKPLKTAHISFPGPTTATEHPKPSLDVPCLPSTYQIIEWMSIQGLKDHAAYTGDVGSRM